MDVHYDDCLDYVVAVCTVCDVDSGTRPDHLAAEQWWLEHATEHDQPTTVASMTQERDDILAILKTQKRPGVYAVPCGELADRLIARARALNEAIGESLTYNLHAM